MQTCSWKRELSIMVPHPTKPSWDAKNLIYPKGFLHFGSLPR